MNSPLALPTVTPVPATPVLEAWDDEDVTAVQPVVTAVPTLDFTPGGLLPTVTPTPVWDAGAVEPDAAAAEWADGNPDEEGGEAGALTVTIVEQPIVELTLTGGREVAESSFALVIEDTRGRKENWQLQVGLLPISQLTSYGPGANENAPVIWLTGAEVTCGRAVCPVQLLDRMGAPMSGAGAIDEGVTLLKVAGSAGLSHLRVEVKMAVEVPARSYRGSYEIQPFVMVVAEP